MLSVVGPEASVDLFNVLLLSGALSALLVQPVLANVMQCIFVAIDPLCIYCGKIAIPFKVQKV